MTRANKRQKAPTPQQLAIRAGDPILRLDDKGVAHQTRACSDPWQLGHGDWVIGVEGVVGGYLLTRCYPVGEGA